MTSGATFCLSLGLFICNEEHTEISLNSLNLVESTVCILNIKLGRGEDDCGRIRYYRTNSSKCICIIYKYVFLVFTQRERAALIGCFVIDCCVMHYFYV